MQIEKECEPYLASTEVIRIIQSRNEAFTGRILNCIQKYKAFICANIITVHQLLEKELLKMCSENAFQDTQLIFLKNVKENKFSAEYDTCIPYLKVIFRRKFWHEYQRELNRKMAINNRDTSADTNNDEEAMNETKEKVTATLAQLSEEDKKIYRLRYEEGLKPAEIAKLLPLQPQTVREKLCKLHRRFGNHWNF